MKVKHDEIDEFQSWAAARKWKALVAPCVEGEEPGTRSAGVAILVRQHIGLGWISPHPSTGSQPEPAHYKGRALVAQNQIPDSQPIMVISSYHWHSEGWSPRNRDLQEWVIERIQQCHPANIISTATTVSSTPAL